MKFSKLGFMIATAMFAVGAFADAANVLISFSTEKDYYADGITAVEDGEWYALCWSPRETFGGLDLNCNPIVDGDHVLILAPLAKDGRCPSVIFQVDSAVVKNLDLDKGHYFVYVLDTRDAEGRPAAKPEDEQIERLVPKTTMNGAIAASSGFTAYASVGQNVAKAAKVEEGTATWAAVQPKITDFGVVGGKVNITVSGVLPSLTYKVLMGETPSTITVYDVNFKSGTGSVEFKELDPGTAKFFTVIGE